MNKLLKFSILLCAVAAIISCGNNQTPQSAPTVFFRHDTVHVQRDSPLFVRLSFVEADEQLFAEKIAVPATVQINPTRLAYVILPFPGRVTRSHVSLGQQVSERTPLFEVVSADFIATQKQFFQAQSEHQLALNTMRRTQELHQNGVASQRDLEEAVNALRITEKEYANAAAAIRIFHPNPERMTVGEPLIIRSPIAGEVIENNVVLGQFFGGDENTVTIANLEKMWVEAFVSERDIRFVGVGSEVELRVNAHPDRVWRAEIFHVSSIVNEDTRMISVRAECDNRDKLLKAGMFATVSIIPEAQPRILVPETAIMQAERQNFVFVRVGETAFVRRYVEVETVSDGKAVIVSGLERGEVIISNGAVYIISGGGFLAG